MVLSYIMVRILGTDLVDWMRKCVCTQRFTIQENKRFYFYMVHMHWKFCTITAPMPLDMKQLSSLMQKEAVFFSVVLLFVMPGRSWAFSAVREFKCFVFPLWVQKTVIFRNYKNKTFPIVLSLAKESLLCVIISFGAKEMAQWVRLLAMQAWGPEFRSQQPHQQLGTAAKGFVILELFGGDTGRSLGLANC